MVSPNTQKEKIEKREEKYFKRNPDLIGDVAKIKNYDTTKRKTCYLKVLNSCFAIAKAFVTFANERGISLNATIEGNQKGVRSKVFL